MKKKASSIIMMMIMFIQINAWVKETGTLSLAIIVENPGIKADPELLALKSFLLTVTSSDIGVYTFSDVQRKKNILKKTDILWFYKNDTIPADDRKAAGAFDALRQYVENGGKMILANQAVSYITALGLEESAPEHRIKESHDRGYGRQLGYHAFREHPLFTGMHGGAYVLKPLSDTTVWQTGYFRDGVPAAGKVVAVDWDYIFLRENSKLILEYGKGLGKVLAVGGYLLYSLPNRNRAHLELFTENLIRYVMGEDGPRNYWDYTEGEEIERPFEIGDWGSFMGDGRWEMGDGTFEGEEVELGIKPGLSSGNYWDLAGERMLVMGTDHGGITEVWAHPVMSLRDYQVSFQFGMQNDTMHDLSNLRPEIEIRPASYVRKYDLKGDLTGPYLEESIAVSPDKPVAVINYRYTGDHPVAINISFRMLFRLMWPYSEKVLGDSYYSWNEKLQAFIATDQSGDFVTIIGVNALRDSIPVLTGMESLSALIALALKGPSSFNIIIASSSQGLKKTLEAYGQTLSDPSAVFKASIAHTGSILNNSLTINCPNQNFNDGYRWALLATDRFHVTTPGIGSSLVAGYATSDKGWDGEHAVSGRPGYGWYFGRDGVWSGFALLHYGDFEKVRLMLEVFQRYQDLNGKIYHELSTSGIVHYDAADATPLYIILAGRYLRHSGDTAFIRSSWPYIMEAVDFCYSTDTDGDLLIENTNVGHGWVEGGHLFGSHTSLHLASLWAASLDEAAYIAGFLNLKEEKARFAQDARKVKEIINQDFWNQQHDYYDHGLMPDGSFMEETSIMPAIPILFGQADQEKANKVLPVIASNAFTADWGCRIVPEHDPRFNPRGYHTGSVWPLFTGWAALAGFKNNSYLQGFSHLSSNLGIWKFWGLGFMEEVLNGEVFLPSGVCHHQCWSETMALQPVIEGMLGYEPDALKRKIYLKPWFPADWDSLSVNGISIGKERISMSVKREKGKGKSFDSEAHNDLFHVGENIGKISGWYLSTYHFLKSPGERLDVHFQPVLPAGSRVEGITVNGLPAKDWGVQEIENGWTIPDFGFWLDSIAVIEILWHGGMTALPLLTHPKPGARSEGFRIINTSYNDSTYTITLQAHRESRQEFRVWAAEPEKYRLYGAEIKEITGNIITLITGFPDAETDYVVKNITFRYISD